MALWMHMSRLRNLAYWGAWFILSGVLIADIIEGLISSDAALHLAGFFIFNAGLLLKIHRDGKSSTRHNSIVEQ